MNRRKKTEQSPEDSTRWLRSNATDSYSRSHKMWRAHRRRETKRARRALAMKRTQIELDRQARLAGLVRWNR